MKTEYDQMLILLPDVSQKRYLVLHEDVASKTKNSSSCITKDLQKWLCSHPSTLIDFSTFLILSTTKSFFCRIVQFVFELDRLEMNNERRNFSLLR